MTQAERERLYGVIAERLAAIGDSYTIDKQDQTAKEGSTSPRGRITVTAGATPDGKRYFSYFVLILLC